MALFKKGDSDLNHGFFGQPDVEAKYIQYRARKYRIQLAAAEDRSQQSARDRNLQK
jgi:hypothetical protein